MFPSKVAFEGYIGYSHNWYGPQMQSRDIHSSNPQIARIVWSLDIFGWKTSATPMLGKLSVTVLRFPMIQSDFLLILLFTSKLRAKVSEWVDSTCTWWIMVHCGRSGAANENKATNQSAVKSSIKSSNSDPNHPTSQENHPTICGFPKIGLPPVIILFSWPFHEINHPATGYPHDHGNPHM